MYQNANVVTADPGSAHTQITPQAFPLIKRATPLPSCEDTQRTAAARRRGGLGYDTLTWGQSVPKLFHSHSFRNIHELPQLFSFPYVQYACSVPRRKHPGVIPLEVTSHTDVGGGFSVGGCSKGQSLSPCR